MTIAEGSTELNKVFMCLLFKKSGCRCLKIDGWVGRKGEGKNEYVEAKENKCRAIFQESGDN